MSSPFSSPWGDLGLLDSSWDLQSPGGSEVLSGFLWVILNRLFQVIANTGETSERKAAGSSRQENLFISRKEAST